MSDIPAVDEGAIQEQETQFQAAVGEYTMRRFGSIINWVRSFFIFEHAFKMNGPCGAFAGKTGVDGLFVFPENATIVDVIIYRNVAGSGGSMQLDVKLSSFPSGSFSTIFSTEPVISSSAAGFSTCGVGDTVTGCTAPILTSLPLSVNAKDRLRMDVISMETGFPETAGIIIKYKPR